MARVHSGTLPADLVPRLVRLRRRVKWLAAIRGAGVTLAVFVVGLAIAFAADWLLDLGAGPRIALLAGVASATLFCFGRGVVHPLWNAPLEAELAALVERSHPELGERLTSAIELADPNVPDEHKGSALMRHMLVRQTSRAVGAVDFDDAVPVKRTVRWGLIGAAALLVLLAPLAVSRSGYGLLWARFLHPGGNHERAANLYFVVERGDRVVPRGEEVRIQAKPAWRIAPEELPESVQLTWTDAAGVRDSLAMRYDSERGEFTASRPHVFTSFVYEVSSREARSREYRIEVVERPEIAAVSLHVQPPAYTGLPAARHDGLIGTTTVFEGSSLALRLDFNKPVAKAELLWDDRPSALAARASSPGARRPFDLPESAPREPNRELALADDGQSATLEFVPVAGGTFSFRPTDEHGLHNSAEPRRVLAVTPDLPPVIELAGSDRDREALPSEVVSIAALARDDVGVAQLELHWELRGGPSDWIAVDRAALGAKQVAHEFALDVSALAVREGSVIEYRVRAVDERPVPGPNETWSNPRRLVVRRTAKAPSANDAADRQESLRQELAAIRRDVEAHRGELGSVLKEAEGDLLMQLEFKRDGDIRPLPGRQDELARRTEQLAARFAQHPLYANLAPDTRTAAREQLDPRKTQLDQATDVPLFEKASILRRTQQSVNEAEETLAKVAEEFEKLAELENDLLELERLADEARRLATEVARLQRDRDAPLPDDATPAEQQAREQALDQRQASLQQDQQALDERLNELLERRPELLDAARQAAVDRLAELSRQALQLAEPQDELAEALRAEAAQQAGGLRPFAEQQEQLLREAEELAAEQQALAAVDPAAVAPLDPQALREALDALREGDVDRAQVEQGDAAEELERLAAELARNERLPADPQQAVAQLAERQEQLRKKIAEANEERPPAADPQAGDDPQRNDADDPAALRRRLRPLAAEQAAIQAGLAQLELPRKNREDQQAAVDQAAEAVERLLAPDAPRAEQSAAEAAESLKQLAERIGTEEERRAAAQEEVAALRKRQDALARQVGQAARPGEAPNVDPMRERLARLAKEQEEIARDLAQLDAPEADAERRDAVREAAAALTDLERERPADAPRSQERAEQALARLDNRLAGERSPAEQAAELRREQAEIAGQAQDAAQRNDEAALANRAAEQRALAERIERLEAPAARPEQRAARRAADEAAQAMNAETPPEQLARAAERSDEALERLASALDPEQPGDAAEQAAELARRQQELSRQAEEAARAERAADAAERLAREQQAGELQREAERLRAGDLAQQEKRDALEMLRKAEEAREQLARAEQEFLRKNEPPRNQPDADRPDADPPRQSPPKPPAEPQAQPIDDELQRLLKRNAEAEREAAEALERLRRRLDDEESRERLAEESRRAAERAEQLARENERQERLDPEQLARQARELAEEQARLREQTEQLAREPQDRDAPQDAEARAEQRQRLAEAQQQLREQAERLPGDQSPLARSEAMRQMAEARQSLEQERSAQASRAQRGAEEALRDIARQAEAQAQAQAQAQAGNQPADPLAQAERRRQAAEQAADLARRQEELRQQVAGTNPQRNPAGQQQAGQQQAGQQQAGQQQAGQQQAGQQQAGQQQAGQQQAGQQQAGQQQSAMQQAQARQQEIAREAARLALDAARQQGAESAAAQQAADFARQANQANRQVADGQPQQAAQSAQQAARSGEQAAQQMAAAGAAAEQLGRLAEQLAQRQAQVAQEFEQAANSAAARMQAQAEAENRLAQQAGRLEELLEEAARRMAAQPLSMEQQGQQAQAAGEAAGQAQQSMQQASGQLGQGNAGLAAQLAEAAAEALRRAAGDAQQAGQGQPGQGQPGSPVPGQVGEQVANASRNLQEAMQQLANASQPGQGQPGQGQPGQGQPGQGQPGQGQPGQGQPGQGQPGQGQPGQGQPGQGQPGQGQPGRDSLAQSAESLRQAAEALAQAALGLQCDAPQGQGGGRPGQGQPGQGQQQANAGEPSDGEPSSDGLGDGGGGEAGVDLARLEAELGRLTNREWGKLPGQLQTDIVQAASRRPGGDYAQLIKLYFKEIAETGSAMEATQAGARP
ncbi:MAG: hypothetical protein WD066_00950 [Planctomycetaceae bacterium]